MSKAMKQLDALSGSLPGRLADELRLQNPWWSGRSTQALPPFHRWPFDPLLRRLTREKPLARINILRGPRQIGKSTLQLQIIERLLASGVSPHRIMRIQFDDLPSFRSTYGAEPILQIVEWYEKKWQNGDLNKAAKSGTHSFLFFDEVQNLSDWDVQLKALVDRTDVRVLVTGSSALRIERGRDSLAGRIQSLEVGPFRLSEIATVNSLGLLPAFESGNGFQAWSTAPFWQDLATHGRTHRTLRDATFSVFSERGGYPLAQNKDIEWNEIAHQLNETVIKRVIQHDLRLGERGRKRDAQLLEEMFRMTARYCGQSPSLTELAKQARDTLEANVGTQRVRTYIDFLDSSLLVRAIQPLEIRLKKRRGAPKFCLSDHALRAAWLGEIVPIDPVMLESDPSHSSLAGRIAESCVGYFFSSLDIPVSHLPERKGEREVDFVITAGDHRIPVEIKYQSRIDPVRDIAGLQQFMAKKANRATVGVLVTRDDFDGHLPDGIVAIPLKTMLLAR